MSGGEVTIEHVETVSITVQSSGNWARVVLDVKPRPNGGGAMLAIVSSFGNYGTWFSSPGEDFPRWVADCDDAYLSNRLRPYGKPTRQQEREVSALIRTLWPLVRSALRIPDAVIPEREAPEGGATKWTPRRYNAAIQAIGAMLAGEVGEGDSVGLTASELEAAHDILVDARDRAARARDERLDAKLRVELGKPRPTKAAAEPECECGHVRDEHEPGGTVCMVGRCECLNFDAKAGEIRARGAR